MTKKETSMVDLFAQHTSKTKMTITDLKSVIPIPMQQEHKHISQTSQDKTFQKKEAKTQKT